MVRKNGGRREIKWRHLVAENDTKNLSQIFYCVTLQENGAIWWQKKELKVYLTFPAAFDLRLACIRLPLLPFQFSLYIFYICT